MAFEHYINSGGKRLRCGYTTGTCAALAAAGATELLLTGRAPEQVHLMTPKGILVEEETQGCQMEGAGAVCGIRKDAGDDIDATAGLVIFARVERVTAAEITIEGGEGVGRVTKPGLDQPVGAAAINRVPREMIAQEVEAVCAAHRYRGGIQVTIFVPNGEQVAKKTFNPNLGVEGGISILGTSGIVEPMSMQALVDTISIELRQAAALKAKGVILTPGNYGMDFLQEQGMDRLDIPIVKCSNFIGEALDEGGAQEFSEILLVGHVGKLVKIAGGIMNTHSRWADCRTELFCAYGAICGAEQTVCCKLMGAATADQCITILKEAGLWERVLDKLLEAIQRHLDRRAAGRFQVGAVLFSNQFGTLGHTQGAKEILKAWKR